ncbi:MAG TPA: RNA polymerase sigma factor [Candidatus Saccharimonadales bacterium]|nr:RNA polymerase sigma factor [Candidatus Saccharimonadales bacterium]
MDSERKISPEDIIGLLPDVGLEALPTQETSYAVGQVGVSGAEVQPAESYESDEPNNYEVADEADLDAPDASKTVALVSSADLLVAQSVLAERDRQFEAVYKMHHKQVEGYVYALIGKGTFAMGVDAEAITQETFIRMLNHPEVFDESHDGYEHRTNPKAWLFTVAKNILVDAVRRAKTRPVESHLHDDTGNLTAESGYDEQGYDKLDFGIFGQLPDHLRPKLRFFYLMNQGYTIEEIATILGIASGTVRSSMYYARPPLQKAFTEMGYDHGPVKRELGGARKR